MKERNHEGYRDPTAFHAITQVENQRRREKRKLLSYQMAEAGGFLQAGKMIREKHHDK